MKKQIYVLENNGVYNYEGERFFIMTTIITLQKRKNHKRIEMPL
jgi:hypothetical protein